MEHLNQRQTVNSEQYGSTLIALKTRLRQVWCGKDSIMRTHTQDALVAQLKLATLQQPAYSPNPVPFDYFFFPQLMKYMKRNHYGEVVAVFR